MKIFHTALLLFGTLLAATTVASGADRLTYGPHENHRMTVWHGRGSGPHPVFVWFHGGGFVAGGPTGGPLRADLNRNGITVVGASYRFLNDAPTKREVMDDGARVIQYLRANAEELDIIPDQIGVGGFSAGGVVASWVALHDDIADSTNEDPVLRESSRVNVCLLDRAQVHHIYLADWINYTLGDPEALMMGVLAYVTERLSGGGFRQPFDIDDFDTQAEYDTAFDLYQRDTFAFYQATSDDPPLGFLSYASDDPNRYIERWRDGRGLHSPLLMIPLQQRLEEVNVPTTWSRRPQASTFVKDHLVPAE